MRLIVDPEKCCGCRLCETACTYRHEGNYGSKNARVRVVKLESQGIDYPVFCQQCNNPACVRHCPTDALSRDPLKGVIKVEEELCTSCGKCVLACPFGACNLHPRTRMPLICDLCGGTPACAEACPTGAIGAEGEAAEPEELAYTAQCKRKSFSIRMCRKMLEKWGKR